MYNKLDYLQYEDEEQEPSTDSSQDQEQDDDGSGQALEPSKQNDKPKKSASQRVGDVAQNVKRAKEVGTKVGKLSKILGPLMPVLGYVAIIVAVLIAAIGLLMVILTMPGAIFDKVKQMASDFGNSLIDLVIGKANNVKQSQISDVATHLENMGYDLYAYGFESDKVKPQAGSNFWGSTVYHTEYLNNEVPTSDFFDSSYTPDVDTLRVTNDGILRDKDGIVYIESDYIKAYLVSDNYVYMIKNNNNNLKNIFNSIIHLNFFRTLFGKGFGEGLIMLYHEGGSIGTIGSRFSGFDAVGGFLRALFGGSRIQISIDRPAKQLVVTTEKNGLYGIKRQLNYNLDGWTGRYGMPLEFLLSLHLSSMQPDLAYDLVTRTKTEIQLVTHESKATVKGGVKVGGAIMDSDELKKKKEELLDALGEEMNQALQDAWNSMPGHTEEEIKAREDKQFEIQDDYYNQMSAIESEYDGYIALAKKLNTDFNTYIPYIYQVENHWYRDVFFTDNDVNKFIQTDEEYEARTGERWTVYETVSKNETGIDTSDVENVIEYDDYAAERSEYTRGGLGDVQYKLYYYRDGNINDEVYYEVNGKPGTKDDASRDTSLSQASKDSLHKKADLEKSQAGQTYVKWDEADDDWEGKLSGYSDRWVAYKEEKNQDSGWKKYEPDTSSGDEISESEATNLYYKIILESAVVQIEDGQRGETNPLAKEIFSVNRYYTYNGTAERAKDIDDDRYGSRVKSEYENFKKGEDTSFNTDSDPRNPDLLETFSVTRDSISAFNILTNMNTLDSDSIYHDFKELIVELDFFDKEELTNVPSSTFEWLIPERGSSNWPKHRYDKSESDYGTLIHSEKDYNLLMSKTKIDMLSVASAFPNADYTEEGVESGVDETVTSNADAFIDSSVLIDNSNLGIANAIAGIATNFTAGTGVTGAGNDIDRKKESGDGYDYKITVDGVEYTHYYQFKGSYAEKYFHGSGGEKTIHNAGCGPTSTVNIATGYNPEVNPTANIVGYSHNQTIGACAKMFEEMTGVHASTEFSESEYAAKIHEAFSEGKPCIVLVRASKGGDTFWTKGGHFVALCGEDSSGNLITLDPGSSKSERHTYPLGVEGIVRYSVALMIPDEPPSGAKKKEKVEEFKGYKPGDYVVSPVTGVVIDAGTTQKIKNIETRTLEYEENHSDVDEYVGFVKIRVLDETDFVSIFGASSKDNPAKDDEEHEGFKYFLDEYRDAKVTGNVVYIEGFNLELLSDKNTINTSSKNVFSDDGKAKNLYTPTSYDDVINKNAKKELQEKEKLRTSAVPVESTSAGILIKEGTVLGTCYDDGEEVDEVLEDLGEEIKNLGGTPLTSSSSSQEEEEEEEREITMRPGVDGSNGSYKLTKNDMKKVGNGNHIRIIMRASKDGKDNTVEKDSIIENVEDYLELMIPKKKLDLDWEFFYYVPYESGPVGEVGEVATPPKGAGANSNGQLGATEANCGISQWTTYPGHCNNVPVLCEALAAKDPSLCGSLAKYAAYKGDSNAQEMLNHWNEFKNDWEAIYRSDPDAFLQVQMEYVYEDEYKSKMENKSISWLLERPLVVQGTYYSVCNYTGNVETDTMFASLINQGMDNETIIDTLLTKASTIQSSVGSLASRFAVAQPKLAKDILSGAFTDVEGWVRTKQPSTYDTSS